MLFHTFEVWSEHDGASGFLGIRIYCSSKVVNSVGPKPSGAYIGKQGCFSSLHLNVLTCYLFTCMNACKNILTWIDAYLHTCLITNSPYLPICMTL